MPKGVVVIRVKEAQGKNRAGEVVWDPNFTEGFIRAELRFADSTKVVENSTTKRVVANAMTWDEELRLDVRDNSKELRLMLCKEKKTGNRTGTSCVSACGIFIDDILQAVPINKFFELFKPRQTENPEGGFIKVTITFEDHAVRPRPPRGVGAPQNNVPNGGVLQNNAPAAPAAAAPRAFATEVSGNLDNLALAPQGAAGAAGAENQPPLGQRLRDIDEPLQGIDEEQYKKEGSGFKKMFFSLVFVGAGAALYLLQNQQKIGKDKQLTKKDFSDKK
jgi:hypothetical protein